MPRSTPVVKEAAPLIWPMLRARRLRADQGAGIRRCEGEGALASDVTYGRSDRHLNAFPRSCAANRKTGRGQQVGSAALEVAVAESERPWTRALLRRQIKVTVPTTTPPETAPPRVRQHQTCFSRFFK